MGKAKSSLMTMVLCLLLIAVAAASALAGVYMLTKPSIDQVEAQKKSDAMKAVLPNFKGETKLVPITLEGDNAPVNVNLAYNVDGTLFGAAVETYTMKAFSGSFTIMVGFDTTGTILGTEVIKASETPGLGSNISNKEKFSGQFADNKLNPSKEQFQLKVKKDGGTVDAITAATISSRAFCDAVNRGAEAFELAKKKGVSK